ncbi:hypothetical protein BZA70DRAFT_270891 [Myxozyma melibiosi]|uniref:BZIP domain-containing protein n=1 Tax=Myxozyma melibiosi TaxID=54550 RepID=A0ABR1FBP8_9ASCO
MASSSTSTVTAAPVSTSPPTTATEAVRASQAGISDSLFASAVTATNSNLARLSKTVAATSTALTSGANYGELTASSQYRSLMSELAPTLRKPAIQKRLFSFKGTAAAMARGRATTSIADGSGEGIMITKEMLQDLPDGGTRYSLIQGFNATLPEPSEKEKEQGKMVYVGKGKNKKMEPEESEPELTGIQRLVKSRQDAVRKMQRIEIRKAIVEQNVTEIDRRIEQLLAIKNRNMERLAKYEDQELEIENKIQVIDYRIELLQEEEQEERNKEAGESEEVVTAEKDEPEVLSHPPDTMSILLSDSLDRYSETLSLPSEPERASPAPAQSSPSPQSPDEQPRFPQDPLALFASVIQDDNYDSDSDSDEEQFARDMTESMQEAWVSSFMEWDRLTGE